MNGSNLKARIRWEGRRDYTNFHENYKQSIADLGNLFNPKGLQASQIFEGYNASTEQIKGLINDAVQTNTRLRALGSGWSFSRVPVTNGKLLNTWNLTLAPRVRPEMVSPDYAGKPADLFFCQCGLKILHINRILQQEKRSLKASGASNGQTIVGALSTGTHGSAIDGGAVQDSVVGLHLIVGPSKHVWLERKSYPVASQEFVNRIGATLKRDDTLFNSALVSFGSFGFVHGVMLETEKIYLLERFAYRKPYDDNMKKAIDALDFSGLQLPHGRQRPYHFSLIANPHNMDWIYMTVMYKQAFDPNHVPPSKSGSGLGASDDLAAFMGRVIKTAPSLSPTIMTAFYNRKYTGTESRPSFSRGTLGETFDATTSRGKLSSTAMGVSLTDALPALELILKVHRDQGPKFAGAIGIRFVNSTQALLGFTQFPSTCIIELDGLVAKSTDTFYDRVWNALEQEKIKYTLHWGKINRNLNEQRLRKMYGNNVDRWLKSRETLLDAPTRQAFTNAFLEDAGLAR